MLRKLTLKKKTKTSPDPIALIALLVSIGIPYLGFTGKFYLFTAPQQRDVLRVEETRDRYQSYVIDRQVKDINNLEMEIVDSRQRRSVLLRQNLPKLTIKVTPEQRNLAYQFLDKDAERKADISEFRSNPIMHNYLAALSEQLDAEDKVYTMLTTYFNLDKQTLQVFVEHQQAAQEAYITAEYLWNNRSNSEEQYKQDRYYKNSLVKARIASVERLNAVDLVIQYLSYILGILLLIYILVTNRIRSRRKTTQGQSS